MRAIFLVILVLASTTTTLAASDARTVVEPYVAGFGDVGCAISGLGCVRMFAEGAETTATIRVDDESGRPIAFDVCTDPTCTAASGAFCASGTLTGIVPGATLTIFLREATGAFSCGLFRLGAATTGTVTATFT